MEGLELSPSLALDGRSVRFMLSIRGDDFECTMSREALEQHFWLQSGASEMRVLKAFEDGRRRIMAVAARKALARGGERIVLSVADFDAGA